MIDKHTVGSDETFLLEGETDYFRMLFAFTMLMSKDDDFEQFDFCQRLLKAAFHDVIVLTQQGKMPPITGTIDEDSRQLFREFMVGVTEEMQRRGFKFEEKDGKLELVTDMEAYD